MEIFSRKKYFFATLVILPGLGFSLMADPVNKSGKFNDAVFSFRKITLAPFVKY